jgi:septin family protein
MGHTKKLLEQMTLDELITEFFNQTSGDEDYQYELYRERQLEAEQQAYEQHLADRY